MTQRGQGIDSTFGFAPRLIVVNTGALPAPLCTDGRMKSHV